ncbi:uncharacterized protein PV09_02355 [Verruconis gallopava]|uniref:Zn(2)-C6 fungal-type domain-containing protein n=1 Tax=Verruconis gallopava TaxID=253628 RepID=A0A0D2AJA7_9PEZI|nr:uncharacterized protein PV09_02355 [Verruconis gallopava]KIW06645.1 hypothetical protein PV09_02355 [Verruconis gallopava]
MHLRFGDGGDAGMATEHSASHIRARSGPYPSPQPYPSPHMQPSYAYPSPHGNPAEPFRHSPASSNAALPSVSLPPLRSIDGQHLPPPPHQLLPHTAGPHMGRGMPPMAHYYGHPPPGMPHPGHAMQYARYAPIPQGTAIPGSRGKKEIKRRTKTGCLTCRKRRIKCDEQHPVCRNCQKSKRECLGYDPIFKQQSGPQALQPAPGGTTSSASPTPSTATSGAAPYSPAQATYPSQQSSSTFPQNPQNVSAPSPKQPNPLLEGSPAIDPALASSPIAERKPYDQSNISAPPTMDVAKLKPARQLSISDLFQVGQYGPYDISSDGLLDETMLGEVQNYYRKDLAPGFDRLLETDWFSSSGLAKLLSMRSLCVEIAELLQHFTRLSAQNGADAEYRCRATEARAVWNLLCLCKPDHPEPQIDLETPHGRLEVLECLLTNRLVPEQNLKPTVWEQSWSREKTEDLMFWTALSKFLARRSDVPSSASEMDKFLVQCRSMLNGRENRDVFYSLMVTRHIGWRVAGFPHAMHPEQGGESSSINKVYIAHKFIADEAGYRGTNHPIQRICDMAMRSWAIGW